jgi:DNA ligase D-like protein (predicted polymerase)
MGASPYVELEVGPRTVRVTNPDKVFFRTRGETKLDLVRYYLSVGDGIVRALYERPTQLKRHPDGAEGEAIYQKRVPEKRPDWIEVARVTFPSGRHADELCVTELAHVAWAVNLATLDFHPWPSRRRDTEHPDELRIDIDPQPGTSFRQAKVVAATVHQVLAEIGYTGWPKTSGNRGIHVACRIEPRWEFPVVRSCALAFAREVERRLPKLVTTAWWKEERGRRVFIDYNQNARDRTIASAYSVRARPDATVSAPVTWDELPDVETEDFTTCACCSSGSSATGATAAARSRTRRTFRSSRASRPACSPRARARPLARARTQPAARVRPPAHRRECKANLTWTQCQASFP